MALAPQPTPTAAPVLGAANTAHTIPTTSAGPPIADPFGAAAPARTSTGHVVDGGQRKLTFLVALPAILLLLPLFVLPFIGRRRYY